MANSGQTTCQRTGLIGLSAVRRKHQSFRCRQPPDDPHSARLLASRQREIEVFSGFAKTTRNERWPAVAGNVGLRRPSCKDYIRYNARWSHQFGHLLTDRGAEQPSAVSFPAFSPPDDGLRNFIYRTAGFTPYNHPPNVLLQSVSQVLSKKYLPHTSILFVIPTPL